MSGINWGMAEQMAKHKAQQFANKYNNPESGAKALHAAYNAYFAGYMENAAERESLRIIVERLEAKVSTPIVDKPSELDGLV